MCNNLQPIAELEAIVYKIVAKRAKGTRYYSVAMGFKYPRRAGRIPKIKIQHRVSEYFNEVILKLNGSGYTKKMTGRTAGFVYVKDAKEVAERMIRRLVKRNYLILVVRTELTDGLMSGDYGGFPVIAGRHIEWLE